MTQFPTLEVEQDGDEEKDEESANLCQETADQDTSTNFDLICGEIVTRDCADAACLGENAGDVEDHKELGNDGVRDECRFWTNVGHHSSDDHVILRGDKRWRDNNADLRDDIGPHLWVVVYSEFPHNVAYYLKKCRNDND